MSIPITIPPVLIESFPDSLGLPDVDMELFRLEQFDLLNVQQGLNNCGSDSLLLKLLTLMAVEEIPSDLERLMCAFDNNDLTQVQYLAHKIKGGAVYVGTIRMKFACQYLERYWKSGERKLFNDLYLQAVKTIQETRDYLTVWLRENQPEW